MNKFTFSIILSTIAGISTLLGFLCTFMSRKRLEKFLPFSLSLSFFIMIFISLFDLIPNAIGFTHHTHLFLKYLCFALAFLIGNKTIRWIDKKIEKGSREDLYNLGILNMIGLLVHNLPEGILTFMSTYQDLSLGIPLCIAISLHNVPEGISIAVPIYYSTKSRRKSFKAVLLASLAEPVGALLCFVLLKNYISDFIISILLVFVASIMLSISYENTFDELKKHKKRKPILVGFLVSLALIIIDLLF